MARPYSIDLRERVVSAVLAGELPRCSGPVCGRFPGRRFSTILLDFGQTEVVPKVDLEKRRMMFMENRYSSGQM